MRYSVVSGVDACSQPTSAVYYSNSATLALFSGLSTNVGLTIDAPAGFYCLVIGCPNDLNIQYIEIDGSGIVVGQLFC